MEVFIEQKKYQRAIIVAQTTRTSTEEVWKKTYISLKKT
jgi:hypothetical protein